MKQFKIIFLLLSTVGVVLLITQLQSCRHDPIGVGNLKEVCFEGDILPMLKNSCGMSGCHDGSSGNGRRFNVSDYQSVMKIVTPGSAKNSQLYLVLGKVYGNIMPPNPYPPLSQENRTLIEVWIEQGAKDTKCDSTGAVTQTTNADTICFSQSVLPILRSSCGITGCHDAITNKEGYTLVSYATLTQRSGSIVPFNPGASRIFSAMTNGGEDIMPPTGALPAAQIELFRKWIAQGAVNSDCPQLSCDTTGTISFASQVWPIIQNNCLGCHGATNPSGGVSLTNYTQVKSYADNLRNSTPVILGAIKQLPGFFSMPPSGKLDDCTIRKIELWIQQGKQNN
jgi:uncharacterized membrane protein